MSIEKEKPPKLPSYQIAIDEENSDEEVGSLLTSNQN